MDSGCSAACTILGGADGCESCGEDADLVVYAKAISIAAAASRFFTHLSGAGSGLGGTEAEREVRRNPNCGWECWGVGSRKRKVFGERG